MTTQWWEEELPAIARELRNFLVHRCPSLQGEHDDLVSDTLLALTQWMRRHETEPAETRPDCVTENERPSIHALAIVILKRRLADLFRLRSREWGRRVSIDASMLASVPSRAVSVERALLLRRMLDITVGVLATLDSEDRDLLACATATLARCRAMTPRERQRLWRARRKIAASIIAELGQPAADLLREDTRSESGE